MPDVRSLPWVSAKQSVWVGCVGAPLWKVALEIWQEQTFAVRYRNGPEDWRCCYL